MNILLLYRLVDIFLLLLYCMNCFVMFICIFMSSSCSFIVYFLIVFCWYGKVI